MGIAQVKNTAINLCKDLGSQRTSISAFERKADSLIGEELVHRLSGRRFFKASELHSRTASMTTCPVEITPEGYRGITNEYFEALKKMKIRVKEVQYGNKEIVDEFTGQPFWEWKRTDGTILGMTENRLGQRDSTPKAITEKLVSWFGDISR